MEENIFNKFGTLLSCPSSPFFFFLFSAFPAHGSKPQESWEGRQRRRSDASFFISFFSFVSFPHGRPSYLKGMGVPDVDSSPFFPLFFSPPSPTTSALRATPNLAQPQPFAFPSPFLFLRGSPGRCWANIKFRANSFSSLFPHSPHLPPSRPGDGWAECLG